MREVDRWAIEELGVAGLELMERAGAAVVQLITDGQSKVGVSFAATAGISPATTGFRVRFDDGSSIVANSLTLGCDCLGEIRYLDAIVNDDAIRIAATSSAQGSSTGAPALTTTIVLGLTAATRLTSSS